MCLTIKEIVYSVGGMDDPGRLNYATPTLMRAARGAYAQSIRAHLHAIGVHDLPRNGAFIMAGIDPGGGPRQDLPTGLGVSKQAVSQLIDVLVSRDYLTRSPDPGDRRRICLELTGRGQEVVERGAARCRGRGSAAAGTRLGRSGRGDAGGAGHAGRDQGHRAAGRHRTARAGRQFRQFSPIFPVSDLVAALAHYAALGFDTEAYHGPHQYGFANRDGIGLHLAAFPGHQQHAAAYLYVRDADALYAEWSRPGIGGGPGGPARPTTGSARARTPTRTGT